MPRALALLATVALLVVPSSSTVTPVSAPRWGWPVAGAHTIVRPYLAPATAYAAGHRGIDILGGGAVLAPAGGVVHFAGFVVDRSVLSISHSGDTISSYEPVTTTLHEGDTVIRGEVIGTIQPGHCIRLCLHFGVRVHGQYVSPMLFLGGIPHSVLLPTRRVKP